MHAWLVALILLISFQSTAFAQSPAPIDIVFDIDWTTFYSIDSKEPNQQNHQTLAVEGKLYRATDHLTDVIETLLIKYPEVRISFFSGGEKSRNESLLGSVYLSDGRSLKEIAHKVLSKADLTVVSQNETLSFSERYKKNIDKGIPDWSSQRTILIDDQVNFAKPPLVAVNSLGQFNYQNQFDSSRTNEKHYPATEAQWAMERNKALLWLAMIDFSIREAQQSGKAFSQVASEVWVKHWQSPLQMARGQQLIQRSAARFCSKVFAF
ncbi:hypothetical protein [Bdellovibrio bacteriovorus]|uniref:hypothetical protein n=1 Tax=Bdellovibrio TaxID=958 RepID=UPI0035A8950F